MKLIKPKPFTFSSGQRAVLLLHGFTGNTGDVRMLGRFLERKGYTCHAPLYKGHGGPLEDLLQLNPEDWWQDALDGYHFLKNKGYHEVAVAGISLGGLFSLKLGYTVPIKGIISMCTPMGLQNETVLYEGVRHSATQYKQLEGKSSEQINQELAAFHPEKLLQKIEAFNKGVRNEIDLIYAPTFIVQGRLDKMIDLNSPNIIYDKIESNVKELKWYEQSGHSITLDKERDQLHEDIYQFLESLTWSH